MAKVQAQLLERLSTGDIIKPRAADPPAKDTRDDYTHGGRLALSPDTHREFPTAGKPEGVGLAWAR